MASTVTGSRLMKILKRIIKSKSGQQTLAFLAASYLKFVFKTNRWEFIGQDIVDSYVQNNKPFIVCFWHGRLAMMPCAASQQKNKFSMLISSHSDGTLIDRVIQYFGIETIFGSTARGGVEATRQIIRALRNNKCIGITPDGPRGPNRIVSPGVIAISKLTQVDIIPISFATSRHKTFNSWDKFHFPLPFGKGVFICGEPIHASKDKNDAELIRLKVEKALNEITERADRHI